MARLIFEEAGGDQFWVEMEDGKLALKWTGSVQPLMRGGDLGDFVQFLETSIIHVEEDNE